MLCQLTKVTDIHITVFRRIVNSFEEMAVEFVQDPSFPLNTRTTVEADNMAFTTIKVPNTFVHCTTHNTNYVGYKCSNLLQCIMHKYRREFTRLRSNLQLSLIPICFAYFWYLHRREESNFKKRD